MGERAKRQFYKGKNLDRSTCRQPDPGVESGAPCTLSRHLVHSMQKHARKWGYKVDTPVQKGFNARRCPDSSVGRAGIENPRVGGSIPSLGTKTLPP